MRIVKDENIVENLIFVCLVWSKAMCVYEDCRRILRENCVNSDMELGVIIDAD